MFKMLWSVLLIAACVLTVECSDEPVAESKVDYGVAASEIVRVDDMTEEEKRWQMKAEENHESLVDGDIDLSERSAKRELSLSNLRTLSHVIYYTVGDLSHQSYAAVKGAAVYLQRHTCITFQKKTKPSQRDYVHFRQGSGCYTRMGRPGERKEVSIGEDCAYIGSALHQMMHVLGFLHENMRADRDKYITINEDQLRTPNGAFLDKDMKELEWSLGPESETNKDYYKYDFNSITHVHSHFYAKGNEATYSVKPNLPGIDYSKIKLGQRDGLSEMDIKRINVLICDKKD